MKSADARAHPRYALEAEIELSSGEHSVRGRTKNVSRGGLCAALDAPMQIGSRVDISVMLVFNEDTFSEPLTLPARVVWCTALGDASYQIGTTFLPLSADEGEYLDMFLRYLQAGGEDAEADAAARTDGGPDAERDFDPFAP